MPNMLRPRHGQWYAHLAKGGTFQVVAIDPDDGLIEVQTFDGAIEEFEREGWRELDIEAIDAPEDCSGPFDEIQPDDDEPAARDPVARDWRIAVQHIDNAPAEHRTRALDRVLLRACDDLQNLTLVDTSS